MEKLYFQRAASLGLLFCLLAGTWAQTPLKTKKKKEHKSQTEVSVNECVSVYTLSLVSFNDFHGAFACYKGVPGAGKLVQTILTQKEKNKNTIVL